jgi:hypothetical protein
MIHNTAPCLKDKKKIIKEFASLCTSRLGSRLMVLFFIRAQNYARKKKKEKITQAVKATPHIN